MVLACHVRSIASLLKPRGKTPPKLQLADVPAYVRDEIGLNALTLSTDLLVGSTPERLSAFRDRADKSACACLMLSEPNAQPFGSEDPDVVEVAIERTTRVIKAAQLLGCNAATVPVEAPEGEESMDRVADAIRDVMRVAEKLELNLLLQPHKGLTADPDAMTDLLKKVGGFRCGTIPDFETAIADKDPETYLKRLTPYATCVFAATKEFGEVDAAADAGDDDDAPGGLEALAEAIMGVEAPPHVAYDLEPLVRSVHAVGFDGAIVLDYRGSGDGTLGVIHSREAIEAALEAVAE